MRASPSKLIAVALMLGLLALGTAGCFRFGGVSLPPPPSPLGGSQGSLTIRIQRAYAYQGSRWHWLAWLLSFPAKAASSATRLMRVTILPPDYPPIAEKTVEVPASGPVSLEFQARVPVGSGYRVAATEFYADSATGRRVAVGFGQVRNVTVYPDRATSVTVTADKLSYLVPSYRYTCEWHYNRPCVQDVVVITPGFKVGGLGVLVDPSSDPGWYPNVGYAAVEGSAATYLQFSATTATHGAPQEPVTLRFRLAIEVYESRDTSNSSPAEMIVPALSDLPIEVTVNPGGGIIGAP